MTHWCRIIGLLLFLLPIITSSAFTEELLVNQSNYSGGGFNLSWFPSSSGQSFTTQSPVAQIYLRLDVQGSGYANLRVDLTSGEDRNTIIGTSNVVNRTAGSAYGTYFNFSRTYISTGNYHFYIKVINQTATAVGSSSCDSPGCGNISAGHVKDAG